MIAVGPGAAKAVAPNMDLAKDGNSGLGEDGIVLKTAPPHLVLTGAEGAKRGTLYAVYEFLERVGGVRWWTPTEEFVPSKLDLRVPALETRYTPPFLYRETLCGAIRPFVWEQTAKVPQFAVRMRQNGHFPKIPDAWGGHCTLIGWCHTFFGHEGLMPPEKYFKDHPDWYSEINGNAQPLAAYLDSLRLAGHAPPAPRVLLATDKTYQAFLAGARVPLPPEAVVDVHENRMSLFEGARLAHDPKASNAAAAQIDPAVYNWSVQVRELAAKGVTGRWHAYAMVRVEPLADTGVAFQGGVYDGRAGKGLIGISQRLEDKTGPTPGESIRDGEYHLYDFGVHDFHDDVYVWISPMGGVGPKNVKAIYVDRFVFVREP